MKITIDQDIFPMPTIFTFNRENRELVIDEDALENRKQCILRGLEKFDLTPEEKREVERFMFQHI